MRLLDTNGGRGLARLILVEKGDNLSRIAKRYMGRGWMWPVITAWNSFITNPDYISPGQKLWLPPEHP